MKIRSVCVGRPKDHDLERLHDRYAERIVRFGIGYDSSWVSDVRATGRFNEDHLRLREAENLAARYDGRGTLIVLDRGGKLLDSKQLADRLERWATPAATLWIGGPLGLHRTALERADESWSLSTLTFPHEIVRLLVAEQLYRALTMARGVPYHK